MKLSNRIFEFLFCDNEPRCQLSIAAEAHAAFWNRQRSIITNKNDDGSCD